ncbi:hypothetical protein C8R43DRAFT_944843 [Mycena crocata]|nr:hypothetical protein C8R43DRAFT_944843 [Mycena crocata]
MGGRHQYLGSCPGVAVSGIISPKGRRTLEKFGAIGEKDDRDEAKLGNAKHASAAWHEHHRMHIDFLQVYPVYSPKRQTAEFERDVRHLEARYAAINGIARLRQHQNDRQLLAEHVHSLATAELMADDFVNAWGPSIDSQARARRARALAIEARFATPPNSPPPGPPTLGSWGNASPVVGGRGGGEHGEMLPLDIVKHKPRARPVGAAASAAHAGKLPQSEARLLGRRCGWPPSASVGTLLASPCLPSAAAVVAKSDGAAEQRFAAGQMLVLADYAPIHIRTHNSLIIHPVL